MRFVAFDDARRLCAVAAGPYFEIHMGLGNPELLEEDVGHRRIVVLAGVDDAKWNTSIRLQRAYYRRKLHEIRPSAGYEIDGGFRRALKSSPFE